MTRRFPPRAAALVLAAALLAGAAALALAADPVPARMPVVLERVPGSTTFPSPPAKAKGTHFIYLIRHGAYTEDTVQTDDRIGSPLNVLGHEQAKLIGARLAALPVHFDKFVSSDFTRARETADDIGAILHRAPSRDSLIHECTPPADNPDYMKNHARDDIAHCEDNLLAAWAKYVVPTPDADTHDLLVCHGNVIRWFVAKTLGCDDRQWSHMNIANASLTVLSIGPDGRTRLVMFSDTGHLPLEKQTWTGRGPGWK